jgi:hypothetical protein
VRFLGLTTEKLETSEGINVVTNGTKHVNYLICRIWAEYLNKTSNLRCHETISVQEIEYSSTSKSWIPDFVNFRREGNDKVVDINNWFSSSWVAYEKYEERISWPSEAMIPKLLHMLEWKH